MIKSVYLYPSYILTHIQLGPSFTQNKLFTNKSTKTKKSDLTMSQGGTKSGIHFWGITRSDRKRITIDSFWTCIMDTCTLFQNVFLVLQALSQPQPHNSQTVSAHTEKRITNRTNVFVIFCVSVTNWGCYFVWGVGGCETNLTGRLYCPRGLRYYKSPELGLNLSGS